MLRTETDTEVNSTENPQTVDTDDITSVLHYDPFAGGDTEIPEVKAPAVTSGTDNASAGGDENPPPVAPAAPATKPAASATPEVPDAAYRQIADQLATIAASAARPQNVEPENTGPKKPAFGFNIPDPLVAALSSQDPVEFKQGLGAFAQGVAQVVFEQTIAYQDSLYKPQLESLPSLMLQAVQQMQHNKSVEQDFYGTYKELDNPMLRPVVKQVATQVASELGKSAWDAELRDATAKRVKELMAFAVGQQQQPAQTSAPAARMLSNQGTRPAVNASVDAVSRDIVDTLFSNDF